MITILNNKGNELSFIIKGINYNFANTIRRAAEEIPILAVDTVEISKNDSVLYDEVLAHRIGLVPLSTEKNFTLMEECTCKGKGCNRCTANLILKAKGPKMVYAGELKSKTIKPIYPEMPLVLLQKDQELELVAEARLGKGMSHAKYAAGLVWFRAYPKIDLAKDCDCEECAKACPKNVYEVKDGKVSIKNLVNCDLCNACVEACLKNGKDSIKVSGSETNFILEIESWGQLTPKEIFIEALKALQNDLKDFDKDINKL